MDGFTAFLPDLTARSPFITSIQGWAFESTANSEVRAGIVPDLTLLSDFDDDGDVDGFDFLIWQRNVNFVPELSSIALIMLGLFGVAFANLRPRQSSYFRRRLAAAA